MVKLNFQHYYSSSVSHDPSKIIPIHLFSRFNDFFFFQDAILILVNLMSPCAIKVPIRKKYIKNAFLNIIHVHLLMRLSYILIKK